MSCRVFGRQLENEAMSIAVEAARSRGVKILRADYTPSERNGVISDLFQGLGFARMPPPADGRGTSRWTLDIASYVARPTHITRRAT